MISRELLKLLHARSYEPRAKRDLIRAFRDIIRGRMKERDGQDLINEIIFNAFLGGKLQATRELRQRSATVHKDEFDQIEEGQRKYTADFNKILQDYRTTKQPIFRDFYRRLDVLGQVAVWEFFNKGKISYYREYDLKIRELTAQENDTSHAGVVMWMTALDERVCEECFARDGKIWPLWGVLPMMPLHPGCRCEWEYIPWVRYRRRYLPQKVLPGEVTHAL